MSTLYIIMCILIIYCKHIKGFINVFFVVNFCHLVILFFKRTFVLVLIFSTTFSPFFVFDITNLLWHPCSLTKQIQWSQCEMYWNTPFIPITRNFYKTSDGISNKLHELEINSYFNFENRYLKWKIYTLIFSIFIWI
jgi:hypothetical protein